MTWRGININYPVWKIDSVISGTNVCIWNLKRGRDNKTKIFKKYFSNFGVNFYLQFEGAKWISKKIMKTYYIQGNKDKNDLL